MIRRLVLFLIASGSGFALPALEASSELALDPWNEPVLLDVKAGTYRLEAVDLPGNPVEFVLERQEGAVWGPPLTNRSAIGLASSVDWSVGSGERWRARPAAAPRGTVILRLQATAFSALRDSLKQTLTPAPEVSLPLQRRAVFGAGGTALAAAAGAQGQLWVTWLGENGAEVWDALRGIRLGVVPGGPWNSLELAPGPLMIGRGPDGAQGRRWTGSAWVSEAAPSTPALTTPLGVFRAEKTPFPRVWRATAAGWLDMNLPQNSRMNEMLLGSTDDGLYALLASTQTKERAFYQWNAGGWTALAPPAASAPPEPRLWTATNGAGSLFVLEGHGQQLLLTRFDGSEWKPPLDLSMLVPEGAKAAVLLPPSPMSRTGTLVLSGTTVSVYDLP